MEPAASAIRSALGELQCAVCLELALLPEALECGHIFCAPCLKQWLVKVRACPSCKRGTEASAGIRLYALDNALRALVAADGTAAAGSYADRLEKARKQSETQDHISFEFQNAGAATETAGVPEPWARNRLLEYAPAMTQTRLAQFALGTQVTPISSSGWFSKAVDFVLESVTEASDDSWEPQRWTWVAAPLRLSLGRGADFPVELRLIVESHNRVLDPIDTSNKRALRLELLPLEDCVAGTLTCIFLQVAAHGGSNEVVAMPCAFAIGECFPAPQALQPAQSSTPARRGITSQDKNWDRTRHTLASLADLLVSPAAPRPELHEYLPQLRTRSVQEVLPLTITSQVLRYDVNALASSHADLFGRDADGRVDGLSSPCFPTGFVNLPPVTTLRPHSSARQERPP
eukprot:TRINITY_DN24605_c0_g2_i4.p1 TRINITY_DN24605_c0_g2~~TRINITY_DN24605_c0_g2_i4.p1  ORF type:complete len:403 (-),score=77.29 TRINITY_DN24605_c0_g2_i4:759-1967(-)